MEKFLSSNYIQTIAKARSISAAAEKLGISQPALSAYLKKQEELLGVTLFDRGKHPIELTEAGKVYIRYAHKFAALDKEFSQNISDLQQLKQGRLTIGGASFFNISYLPRAVAVFAETYPGIDMEIVDGKIPEISMKALNGQLDLFIAPPWGQDDRFQYEELLRERIFLCVPADWEINKRLEGKAVSMETVLAAKGSGIPLGTGKKENRQTTEEIYEEIPCVDFREFENLPFVLLKEDQHIGHVMSLLFAKYGFEPAHWISVEQTMTSYSLTLAGVGISLITESCVRNSGLKEIPKLYLVDRDICFRSLFVAYPKQKYLSKAAREFIKILKINI